MESFVNSRQRPHTFLHALAFVLGFSTVFVVLGASVAFVGSAFNQLLPGFAKLGGALLILFGLQVTGALGWLAYRIRAAGGNRVWLGRAYLAMTDALSRLMYTDGRVQMHANRRWGYLSSALMGVFFSAGWIPCVGPVLAAIYVLASDAQTVGQGALLLLVYSAGLGIPFLLAGAAFGAMTGWLQRLNRHLGMISKITGVFLIFIGALLFMDRLAFLSGRAAALFGTGLASVSLGDADSAALTIPLALVAGVLSFLSPCVLPLIPAYIGYLSGTAIADGTPGRT